MKDMFYLKVKVFLLTLIVTSQILYVKYVILDSRHRRLELKDQYDLRAAKIRLDEDREVESSVEKAVRKSNGGDVIAYKFLERLNAITPLSKKTPAEIKKMEEIRSYWRWNSGDEQPVYTGGKTNVL